MLSFQRFAVNSAANIWQTLRHGESRGGNALVDETAGMTFVSLMAMAVTAADVDEL
jgi:hypothetical protein